MKNIFFYIFHDLINNFNIKTKIAIIAKLYLRKIFNDNKTIRNKRKIINNNYIYTYTDAFVY